MCSSDLGENGDDLGQGAAAEAGEVVNDGGAGRGHDGVLFSLIPSIGKGRQAGVCFGPESPGLPL